MASDINGSTTEQDQKPQSFPIPQEFLALIGEKELIISQLQRENASLRVANAALAGKLEEREEAADKAGPGD